MVEQELDTEQKNIRDQKPYMDLEIEKQSSIWFKHRSRIYGSGVRLVISLFCSALTGRQFLLVYWPN